MIKAYLENLPKDSKNKTIWKDSIGCVFEFEFYNNKGIFKITDVIKDEVFLEYGGLLLNPIKSYHLTTNKFKTIICDYMDLTNDNTFIYEVNEEVKTYNGNLKILSKKYKHGISKYYLCKCLIDGNIFMKPEAKLKHGGGCPVCSKKQIVENINSILAIDKTVVESGIEESVLSKLTSSSKTIVSYKCKLCEGQVKETFMTAYKNNFSCSCCRDGESYPNKFLYGLLNQIEVEYEREKSFPWSNRKRYDLYFCMRSVIVENHGKQHYEKQTKNSRWKTLEEEQANDKLKRKLALANGIEHYIELDCRFSTLEHIKNSIMTSELPTLLNFKEEDIDWIECERFALSNIAKMVREKISEGYTMKQVRDLTRLSSNTIRAYLGEYKSVSQVEININECCKLWNEGENIGVICEKCNIKTNTTVIKILKNNKHLLKDEYSVEASKKRGRNKCSRLQKKKVFCKQLNIIFDSPQETCDWLLENLGVYVSIGSIRRVCSGERKSIGALKEHEFMYV